MFFLYKYQDNKILHQEFYQDCLTLVNYLALGEAKYNFNVQVKKNIIDTIDLFRQLDEKIKKPLSEKDKANLAYSAVKAIIDKLAEIAIEYANENNIKNIGLTGGVSYNLPITDMVEKKLKNTELTFFVHNKVPNGDGGISIGQNVIIGNKLH